MKGMTLVIENAKRCEYCGGTVDRYGDCFICRNCGSVSDRKTGTTTEPLRVNGKPVHVDRAERGKEQ